MRSALRSAVIGAVLVLPGLVCPANAAEASYEVSAEVSDESVGGTVEVSSGDKQCAFASAPAVGYNSGNPIMQPGEVYASNCT